MQVVYDQAAELYEQLKTKEMDQRTNFDDFLPLTCPEPQLDPNALPIADYSTAIHRYLNGLHRDLIESIVDSRPLKSESNETIREF